MTAFKTSLEECLGTESDISISELDAKLSELQQNLISKALSNEDYEELNRQILDLKNKKQKILSDEVHQKQLEERTNVIMDYIESQPDFLSEYDDSLVRFFIEKVSVFEEYFSVELKNRCNNRSLRRPFRRMWCLGEFKWQMKKNTYYNIFNEFLM